MDSSQKEVLNPDALEKSEQFFTPDIEYKIKCNRISKKND
jgi:hypothetical protein